MFTKAFKRTWVSPVVALSFAVVGGTGIVMLFDVHMMGLKSLHEWMGVLMVVAGVVHLTFNWKALLGQLRHRSATIALAAVTVLGVFLVLAGGGEGPHRGGPPMGPGGENAPLSATPDFER